MLALAGLVLASCGPAENATGPEFGPEEGYIVMEGDPDWHTESVTWIDNGAGSNRFAFISIALHAAPNGRSHYLYEAPFHQRGCVDARCFPQVDELFVIPGLAIGDIDRSPTSTMVAFDGRSQTDQDHWIYTFTPGGESRQWLIGTEPTFLPNGSAILFVSDGRDELLGIRPASGETWIAAVDLV